MIVNEIVRAVLSYSGVNASIAQTVHWYILTQANEDDVDVVDRIEEWVNLDWANHWKNQASNEATLTTLEVDVITTDGHVARNIGDRVIDVEGIENTEHQPAGVCGLLTAITGTPKIRGRKYVPFFAEGGMTDGAWNLNGAGALTNLAADYVVDLGGMTGGILESGVLSRSLEEFKIFLPTGSSDTIPAYQRRRKPFVGS